MNKVLVAYATWAGATREIAEFISKTLSDKNIDTTVSPANEVDSIVGFDAVVIGTSIHAGQPIKAFKQFLGNFQDDLKENIPFHVFIVCANMMEDSEKTRTETISWVDKALSKYPGLKPASVGLFGGALLTDGENFNKLNFMIKKMIQSMKENYMKDYGKSDFRDWDKVREWTEQIIK